LKGIDGGTNTRHLLRRRDASGKIVTIETTPRTGADNKRLHAVGATYGVIKLVSDRPHWSDTGH
jgi:hypothetical protein